MSLPSRSVAMFRVITRSSKALPLQARMSAQPVWHPLKVRQLHRRAFPGDWNGPVNIQQVRFVEPWSRVSHRITGKLLYTVLTLVLGNYILLLLDSTFDDIEDVDVTGNNSSNRSEQEKEAEEPFFIGIGWPYQLPAPLYKGGDPEWKSFKDLKRDARAQKELRAQMASLVLHGAERSPQARRILGKNLSVGHFWIRIRIEPRPSPQWMRSGVEIAGDEIAWTTRPITAQQAWRFQQVVSPSAVIKALWRTAHGFGSHQMQKMKKYFDTTEASPAKDPLIYLKENGSDGNVSRPDGQATLSVNAEDLATSKTSPKTRNPGSSVTTSETTKEDRFSRSPFFNKSLMSLDRSFKRFKRTVRECRDKRPFEYPKGCCLLEGSVTIQGDKGFIIFDTVGSYDVLESQWRDVHIIWPSFRASRWKINPE